MKLLTGTRIGQSHGELMAAILFSSFFHIIIISAALLIAYTVRTRVYVPPFYSVKLVDLPADLSQVRPVMTPEPVAPPAVTPPKERTASAAKQKAAAPKAKAAPPKDAMPELQAEPKKKTPDQPPVETAAKPQEAVSVAVAGGAKEFPFLPYLAIVRDKVERNWNPPPGAKGATVKVLFTVLRSGRVGETKLTASSGNFYFDQAAMRAILAASPFPPLPEGFFRDYETFSVDLMERE